jgi:PAP2 superfamily protein
MLAITMPRPWREFQPCSPPERDRSSRPRRVPCGCGAPLADSGLWGNGKQNVVRGDTRLGKTSWQALDSLALASVAAGVGKVVFGRQRPDQTDDPHQWFEGGRSFPSGEVSQVAGIVTPYVLEYGRDNPWVYALELLPAYESVARVKSGEHWQTDVLAGWALGTLTGYLAHRRDSPFILQFMPHSIAVGYRKQF